MELLKSAAGHRRFQRELNVCKLARLIRKRLFQRAIEDEPGSTGFING
jgi:hypothetical protein